MKTDQELVDLFVAAAYEVGAHQFEGLSVKTEVSELGIDSVELLEIFGFVEEELDIMLSDEDLAGLETLGDLIALIKQEL